ncbi:unnamed protein product, partial [Mesorhabditis belari]|uniref:Uncharacterized protein n=1 Tax=Mesorhabditis belari TaxID=2138241 RepID=A0AAF3J911_9BILA
MASIISSQWLRFSMASLFFLVLFIPPLVSQGIHERQIIYGIIGSSADVIFDKNCSPTSNTTCDKYPIGTIVDDRSPQWWTRESCWESTDDFGRKKSFPSAESTPTRFPVYKIHRSAPKDDNGNPPFNNSEIHYSAHCEEEKVDFASTRTTKFMGKRCLYYNQDTCWECPFGYRRTFVDRPDRFNSNTTECVRQSKATLEQIYRHRDELIEQAKQMLKKCPDGMFRQIHDINCTGICPENCRTCRSRTVCDQCHVGYVASGRSNHCVKIATNSCPINTYYDAKRCLPCEFKTKECEQCDSKTGFCEKCERGMILINGRHFQRCLNPCQRGYYMEANHTCHPCPPYCETCVNDHRCEKCNVGLFERRRPNPQATFLVVECYTVCPNGTYPTAAYPFQCLPCHFSCDSCTGPTDRDCIKCETFGQITSITMLPQCMGTASRNDFDGFSNLSQLAFEMTGTKNPMSGGEGVNVYSSYFKKTSEAEDYFKKKYNNATKDMYWPQCDTDDCLKHCAKPTLMQACPYCKKGFSMTLDRKCVQKCPDGMTNMVYGNTTERHIGRCVLCPHYPKCKKCQMFSQFLGNYSQLYNFSAKAYEADKNLTRFKCDEWDERLLVKCDEKSYFHNRQLGVCLPCHAQCDGCTGRGSNHCLKCRYALDISGHCVAKCGEGLRVNSTAQPPICEKYEQWKPFTKEEKIGIVRYCWFEWTMVVVFAFLLLNLAFTFFWVLFVQRELSGAEGMCEKENYEIRASSTSERT